MEDTKAPICKAEGSTPFEALLLRLDPDRDLAGQKYEELRYRLIKFFGWNDCFPEPDLADQTLDRVAHKLGTETIQDVIRFSWGVARNVAREFRKRHPTIDIDDLPSHEAPHTGNLELKIINAAVRRRRLDCLHQCIQQLSAADREIFFAYEYYTDKPQNTAKLAERLDLTVGALQTRAHRIKHKVELCARKCFASRKGLSLVFSKDAVHDER